VQEEIKDERQEELIFNEFEGKSRRAVRIKKGYSKYLYDRLGMIYEEGFKLNEQKDEVFKQIMVGRVIEPSSKVDTIKILNDLGLEAPSNMNIQ
jgi:hypothetical protein